MLQQKQWKSTLSKDWRIWQKGSPSDFIGELREGSLRVIIDESFHNIILAGEQSRIFGESALFSLIPNEKPIRSADLLVYSDQAEIIFYKPEFVKELFGQGQTAFAHSILASIILQISIQFCVILIKIKKNSNKQLLSELTSALMQSVQNTYSKFGLINDRNDYMEFFKIIYRIRNIADDMRKLYTYGDESQIKEIVTMLNEAFKTHSDLQSKIDNYINELKETLKYIVK